MRPLIAAAVGLALASCQWLPGTDANLIEQAKKKVAAELRDPASAQFREVHTAPQKGRSTPAVCGEVNGRNAYGGYAGFQKFYVLGDEVRLDPGEGLGSLEDTTSALAFSTDHMTVCFLEGEVPVTPAT